jgi:hypothetical protein
VSSEVTIKEVMSKYDVLLKFTDYLSWTKTIRFIDRERKSYSGTLHWDASAGYKLTFPADVPKDLLEMAMRPEFEYVLDCITEGDTSD